MTNIILLYDNAADEGTLSGGSWVLPLTNMQDPRPTKMARSIDVNPTSTKWRTQLTAAKTLRAIVFGPSNFSSGMQYRIRAYADSAYSSLINDTGEVTFGATPLSTYDMHWADPNWWSGAQPLDDPGGAAGIWVIHVYNSDVTAQYLDFEIDNSSNPDGFIEIGRLFLGNAYIPSINYEPGSNRAGFASLTSMQQAVSGARYFNRRRAARTFQWQHSVLPADEVHDSIYRLTAIVGTDQQVFIIPAADDTDRLAKRSFLGTLDEIPSWSLENWGDGSASVAFKVTEVI